jgi:uncharacterized membrane protein YfcA
MPRAGCIAMRAHDTARLALIGTAAGLFSGLFGVGGGSVIVPLLVLWLAFPERVATGTSLVAITAIAAVGAAIQVGYGRVHFEKGLLIGLPAVAGVLAGTWLQQRMTTRWLSLLFSALLVATAVDLVAR